MLDVAEHRFHGIQRAHLLVHREELPVVLLHLSLDIFFRELQLQMTDLFAYACQLVAEDNLTTGEDRLDSIHTGNSTLLHHGHRHRVTKPC